VTRHGEVGRVAEPPAGTGPYQFEGRASGAYIRYQRVPFQHWRTTPAFAEFQFAWQKEASTRLASLVTGETHISSLPEDLLVQAQAQGYRLINGRVPGLRTFLSLYCCFLRDAKDVTKGYMPSDSPLMDVRVRKALNKAIDRNALNKAFFGNKGILMVNNHMNPSLPGWNPDWGKRFPEEYGYDPARAKGLLAEAGKPNPVTTIVLGSAPGVPAADDMAEAVASYWRAIGVSVDLLSMDPAQVSELRRQYKFLNHLQVRGTSAGQLLGMRYNSAAGGSSGMQDPSVDLLVQQIYNTLDERRQAELWGQAGELMFQKQMSVPLFWLPAEAVVNPKIVGDYLFPGSISGTWTHVQNIKPAP